MKLKNIPLRLLLLTCGIFYYSNLYSQSIPQEINPDSLRSASTDSSLADSLSAPAAEINDTGLDTTLFYDARIIDTEIDSNRYFLMGDAVVKYQRMTLTAEKIIVDQKNEILIAEGVPDTSWVFNEDSTEKKMEVNYKGTPSFSEGSEQLGGFKMIYNYRTQKGRIIRGRTDYESGKYYGEQIKKVEGKTYNVTNGRFTTCDNPDHPHFWFTARRMKIVQNKEIVGKPVVAYISGIPVAILPFVFFPNKGGRHSGILIPRYGESQQEGRYLQGMGYYWAPSDYFDVTTKFNYYDRAGWMANSAFRYNKRYVMSGNIQGSITKKEPINGSVQNRWDLRFSHNQTIDKNTQFRASGNFVSDASYYKNYSSNPTTRLNQQLQSNATFSKSWPGAKNNITINLNHIRYLNVNEENELPDQKMTLPQISFSHSSRQLFAPKKKDRKTRTVKRRDTEDEEDEDRWYHSIYYSYRSQLINQFETGTYAEKDPISRNIKHDASLTMNSPQKLFGVLGWNHSLSYNETWFDRKRVWYAELDSDTTDTYSANSRIEKGFAGIRTFNYSASANTKLYGMFAPNIGNIVAIRHTMSPSINFGYSPDFTDPAWGYYQEVRDPNGNLIAEKYRYLGGSASSGQKSIGFSVSNLFQMKTSSVVDGEEKENKFDLFTLNFSSSYNFKLDSMKMAPLSATLTANPTKKLRVNVSTSNDFYVFDTNAGRRVNRFLLAERKLPRLTSFRLTLGLQFEGKKKGNPGKKGEKFTDFEDNPELEPIEDNSFITPEGQDRFEVDQAFSGVDIPWSARFDLNYSLTQYDPTSPSKTFYLNLSNAQIQLTKNWAISYQARFDFMKKQVVSQSFNFKRDLHCWEMTFRWVPTGPYKEYYMRINVKASQLQDIKVEKRGGRSSVLGYY